jgi:hypothetical protein
MKLILVSKCYITLTSSNFTIKYLKPHKLPCPFSI